MFVSCYQLTSVVIADVSKASAKVKSEVPGRATEAEKQTERFTAEAKAKADGLVSLDSLAFICLL